MVQVALQGYLGRKGLKIDNIFYFKNRFDYTFYQRHPTSSSSQEPTRNISRLLVMFKDYLKRCHHFDEFDLFGYLS